MSTYFINLPRIEAVEGLENLVELDKQFSVLYKIHNSREYAILQEIYTNRSDTSDGDYLVVPISSTLIGVQTFYPPLQFVNVKGSHNDKPEDDLEINDQEEDELSRYRGLCWLDFYNAATQCSCTKCLTDKYFYNPDKSINANKRCNNIGRIRLVGGHVIITPTYNEAKFPKTINGDEVGIIPICHMHNMFNKGYMKTKTKIKVPMIAYKFMKEMYQPFIDEVKRNEK